MLPTALSKFESRLFVRFSKRNGGRISSLGFEAELRELIRQPARDLRDVRRRVALQRIAIRARPDSATVDEAILEFKATYRYWAERTMPGILQVIEQSNALGLPVPLIFSCRRFLKYARRLQGKLRERYFGISPIIISGDVAALEEDYSDSVLTLPVDDSYEGLPVKVFEAIVFFHCLGAKGGILKIDDDASLSSIEPLDLSSVKNLFSDADYAGSTVADLEDTATFHEIDRSWHYGKCRSNVPLLYGKPFRKAFAAGGLYYLSNASSGKLAERYCRFPGHLEGELYEDKAVGDALLEIGIPFSIRPLGQTLGLFFEWNERSLLFSDRRGIGSLFQRISRIYDEWKHYTGALFEKTRRLNPIQFQALAQKLFRRREKVESDSKQVPPVLPVAAERWLSDNLEHQKAFELQWDAQTAERARALLARVMRIANSLEIPLFLYWGTLLGHVREGKILAWDDDLDLALFDPTKITALRAALISDGLQIHDHDNGYVWIKVVDPSYPITSDFEWTYPFLDIYLYNGRTDHHDSNLPNAIAPESLILPGRRIWFEGSSCLEPEAPMEILDRHYPSWRAEELSPAWDHRTERARATIYKRKISVDEHGRKKAIG